MTSCANTIRVVEFVVVLIRRFGKFFFNYQTKVTDNSIFKRTLQSICVSCQTSHLMSARNVYHSYGLLYCMTGNVDKRKIVTN